MPRRVVEHILAHPGRLLATTLIVVLASWTITIYAVLEVWDSRHQADVRICRQVNELRRDIYIAALDLGLRPIVADRFKPQDGCEE